MDNSRLQTEEKMMWKVPLFDTSFDEKELEAVQEVIRSGWLTMGEVTREFEERFASYLGVRHAFAVSSCTAALHIAMKALEIQAGDEVICPSLTFVAGANSILYSGAQPVFADVQSLDDFGISMEDVEKKITEKMKAIQVVHYGGYPCDMEGIMAVAKKHGLRVVEDAAHAPGAEIGGQKCGAIGDIGCFSFFSSKNMTTAEGGMVTTNDDELAEKIKLLRSHGMTSLTMDRYKGHATGYDVITLGYNYRIDEIRSALGIVQLEKLDVSNARRRKLHEMYTVKLNGIPKIHIPYLKHPGVSTHYIFPVVLDKGVNREELRKALKERGIQTSVHYPPIHLFDYYQKRFGIEEGSLPRTEEIARRELTLPFYPSMTRENVELVSSSLNELLS